MMSKGVRISCVQSMQGGQSCPQMGILGGARGPENKYDADMITAEGRL
jgi:hypothetical protein